MSNRPADTAFKQQRLPAWQPLLTPRVVVASFFIVGAIFIPIGAVILDASSKIKEVTARYDNAEDCAIKDTYAGRFGGTPCSIDIEVKEDIEGPVYMYYQLENFFQNHRKYVSSRADAQLKGNEVTDPAKALSECDTGQFTRYSSSVPDDFTSSLWDHDLSKFLTDLKVEGAGDVTAFYNPCGLIARSFFNDSIAVRDQKFEDDAIAWPSDMEHKFKKPEGDAAPSCVPEDCITASRTGNETLTDSCKSSLKGALVESKGGADTYNYIYNCWFGDTYTALPKAASSPYQANYYESQNFAVWLRTAALPKFKKLRGKLDGDLKAGTYKVDIVNRFPVSEFSGTKSIVLSNTAWIGGKSDFLGTIYCIVGGLCIFLSIFFGALNMWRPRKLGDSKYLVWHIAGK